MRRDVRLFLAFVVLVCAATGAVLLIENAANERQEDAAKANCEAAKLDRIDNARFATAHANYLEKVLAAASVKQDVKDAATVALQLAAESANQQRARLWDCDALIEDGRRVIDKDALLEAQGRL